MTALTEAPPDTYRPAPQAIVEHVPAPAPPVTPDMVIHVAETTSPYVAMEFNHHPLPHPTRCRVLDMAAAEDQLDVYLADLAKAEPGERVSLEDMKRQLDL